MTTYSLGECANSLIINPFWAFAMLYYTQALGLRPSLAGIAMSIAILWDAISDPIMGHVSDNTRSRFGRRIPYVLSGGVLMVICFYFFWHVPAFFKQTNIILFWYLVVLNLLLRTAFTVFIVPYAALGFEICTDYNGRAKLQGIRYGMNMAANFLGPAMAWALFFDNNEVVRATSVPGNYLNMAKTFSVAALIFVLAVVVFTAKYIKDSRNKQMVGNTLKAFMKDMKEIVTDVYPRYVFIFIFVVITGIALVGNLQVYLYEDFMVFSGKEKSAAHGLAILGAALGALSASMLSRRFDKKGAVYIGGFWNILCNVVLAALFLPGILKPGQVFAIAGFDIPVALIVFIFFHAAYYFGSGVIQPIAISMMADISEIHEIKTGINKDGAYSAMFSFAMKCACSLAPLIAGFSLDLIGFQAGAEQAQSPQVLWRVGAITLLFGPAISLVAIFLIGKYPVNKAFIDKIRQQANQ